MNGSIENYSRASVSVTFDHVARTFGSRKVFSDVCGEVGSGRSLIVSGPNGSGKSTLLRIVAGLLRASSGTVTVAADDRPLDSAERRSILGYAAPDLILYPELTAAENLRYFARVRGLEIGTEELKELMKRVGLSGRGRDFVGNYSSGMRQRLKYAFALMHRPPILLLDEPTANLDTEGVEMAHSVVREQVEHGLAIIATNEPREMAWGDTVVSLIPE